MTEKFKALKESKDTLEFWGNKYPKCPHCGNDYDPNETGVWGIYEEGEHEVTCDHCDGDFMVSTNVSYSFSTDTQEDEDDE